MKRALLSLLVAGAAFAATRAKDVAPGAAPSAATDGVALDNAVGCRCSIRVDAGTDAIGSKGFAASGWNLYPWYYDAKLGWVESVSSLRCSPNARLDGGLIRAFVCSDFEPLAQFGRMSCASFGPTGFDGGTGADLIADAGIGPLPMVRTECWGPLVVGP